MRRENEQMSRSHRPAFRTAGLLVSLALLQQSSEVTSVSRGQDPPRPPQELSTALIHLRNRPEREWIDFSETPPDTALRLRFQAAANPQPSSLMWRQQDVKQAWSVRLNGKRLGELVRDENDMTVGLSVPKGILTDGENELVIEAAANAVTDDIRIASVRLDPRPLAEVLSEARLEVTVTDAEMGERLPCRLTLLHENGSLASLGSSSSDELAVRPGTAYAARGFAALNIPAGRFTLIAGRGFEYSIDRVEFEARPGETVRKSLAVRRDVPTPGFVACDPHVHTLTHSGHGDASITERMMTIAGEGIELPVATDHNVHVDFEPEARRLGLRSHFTPVRGNEVTTPRGHFNILPVAPGTRPPDASQTDWGRLFDSIEDTAGVQVIILNHARDLHRGVRPFGPKLHNAAVAENLDGWSFRFHAMEILNSGATQSDPLQLTHDWMELLNAGYRVTPVGSSDSHDVARHFLGQGRTYISCDDRDPGAIDTDAAMQSLRAGRVRVSYGLLTELVVNGRATCGDVVTASDNEVRIGIRVLGPHWVRADRVQLFLNGRCIRDEALPATLPRPERGVLWTADWSIPRPAHDGHLVAVATGPGIDDLFWRTAKPYQPTSLESRTHVLGCSGAVWLDADRDGRWRCARDLALSAVASANGDLTRLMAVLAEADAATSAHAARVLHVNGFSPRDSRILAVLNSAATQVQSGFHHYWDAWRDCEQARAEP